MGRDRIAVAGLCLGLAVFPVTGMASEATSYTYDALGRLVVSGSSGTINAGQVRSICYDKAGNRLSYTSASGGVPAACVTQG